MGRNKYFYPFFKAMHKRQRYNIVRIKLGNYEALLLTKGGEFKAKTLSKPAIKTNFYIKDTRIIHGEDFELIIKIERKGYESVLSIYNEHNDLLREINGYLYTENKDQFTNYEEAKLFFELC